MIRFSFRFEGQKAKQVVSQVMVASALRRCARTLRIKSCEVHVSFLGDRAMRTLNRIYRKKDKPTDVLSFPTHEGVSFPRTEEKDLGDIFINWQNVAARKKIKSDRFRLSAFLAVHGMLHLLGFDHHTKKDLRKMRKKEKQVCGKHTFYE